MIDEGFFEAGLELITPPGRGSFDLTVALRSIGLGTVFAGTAIRDLSGFFTLMLAFPVFEGVDRALLVVPVSEVASVCG